MPTKVVDACAVGALLFGEPEAQLVAERLGDSPLVTTTLFRYELVTPRRGPDYSARKSFRLRSHVVATGGTV